MNKNNNLNFFYHAFSEIKIFSVFQNVWKVVKFDSFLFEKHCPIILLKCYLLLFANWYNNVLFLVVK